MTHQDECPAINDLTAQRPARLCAAILDRRDTVPAPPFSTAVNSMKCRNNRRAARVFAARKGHVRRAGRQPAAASLRVSSSRASMSASVVAQEHMKRQPPEPMKS